MIYITFPLLIAHLYKVKPIYKKGQQSLLLLDELLVKCCSTATLWSSEVPTQTQSQSNLTKLERMDLTYSGL